MEQTLSIIIPVYNKAQFLRRALDSIVNQIIDSVQVIIVDDGSTDGSRQICDEYKRYGFKVYHRNHKGVSSARNYGLEKATGAYITFLDADDAYTKEALDIMTRITRHQMNIIQFGQYRCHAIRHIKDHIVKGEYSIDRLPRRWAMVWNKIYKRSFIEKHQIRFIDGMQFGEDELFNVQAILANNGIYHAPQTTIYHYFDDKKSLCRGELDLDRLTGLVDKLKELAKSEPNGKKAQWLLDKARQHECSALFRRFGYDPKREGQYDVVYFLKESAYNEELRYSLRSLERNWNYNSVWFYGGCPHGIKPDHRVKVVQNGLSKWENVRKMLVEACKNDDITEDFWLFNDDFFIMKQTPEDIAPLYNGSLEAQIARVEARHGGQILDYTKRLRHLVETLKGAGKPTLNYSVHKPILVNRKKALKVLEKFPDEPMFRALYGNYWDIGGINKSDHKIMVMQYDIKKISKWRYLSTSDDSFISGNVGVYIRSKFQEPSRFEEG